MDHYSPQTYYYEEIKTLMDSPLVDGSLVGIYHELYANVTTILIDKLAVPSLAAPIISLTCGLFVPLFFLAALFLSTVGYIGLPKCVPSARETDNNVLTELNNLLCRISLRKSCEHLWITFF
jgi:hypothetical protein